MRCRAADRVDRRSADEQVEVGAHRAEGIVAGRAKFAAALPPAMLAHHHTRIEVRIEPGAHTALWRLDRHPVAVGNPARLRCRGMQLDLWMRGMPAQTRDRAMLGLAE